jgi:hypothetical protein
MSNHPGRSALPHVEQLLGELKLKVSGVALINLREEFAKSGGANKPSYGTLRKVAYQTELIQYGRACQIVDFVNYGLQKAGVRKDPIPYERAIAEFDTHIDNFGPTLNIMQSASRTDNPIVAIAAGVNCPPQIIYEMQKKRLVPMAFAMDVIAATMRLAGAFPGPPIRLTPRRALLNNFDMAPVSRKCGRNDVIEIIAKTPI